MGAISYNLPGFEAVPGDVMQLRRDLPEWELERGYYVLLERIGYYAAICRAGEDEEEGALCRTSTRLTIPASALEHFGCIGVQPRRIGDRMSITNAADSRRTGSGRVRRARKAAGLLRSGTGWSIYSR